MASIARQGGVKKQVAELRAHFWATGGLWPISPYPWAPLLSLWPQLTPLKPKGIWELGQTRNWCEGKLFLLCVSCLMCKGKPSPSTLRHQERVAGSRVCAIIASKVAFFFAASDFFFFSLSLWEHYLSPRLSPQAINWQVGHYKPLGSDWLWGSLLPRKMWNWLSGWPHLTSGILHLTWL